LADQPVLAPAREGVVNNPRPPAGGGEPDSNLAMSLWDTAIAGGKEVLETALDYAARVPAPAWEALLSRRAKGLPGTSSPEIQATPGSSPVGVGGPAGMDLQTLLIYAALAFAAYQFWAESK
jgi:hypothetical protein